MDTVIRGGVVFRKKIVIIDYGMGNLCSVANAFRYLGCEPILASNFRDILSARFLVIPGVGSFRKAMEQIRKKEFDKAIRESVFSNTAYLLGICLGMQLLFMSGSEDGETEGLSLLDGRVDRFKQEETGVLKIPHVGFNTVQFSRKEGLFKGMPEEASFYFVHSYRVLKEKEKYTSFAECNYGISFLAAFESNNICGTQFHPEKSQSNGLLLLRNFLRIGLGC